MPRKQLRPYQQEAVQSFYDFYAKGDGHPLFVIPMRLGKSLIMAGLIESLHQKKHDIVIWSIASDSKLLEQNEAELREYYPFISTSFYCSKLKKKRLHGQVVFGSVQSLANAMDKVKRFPDLLIVDESQDIPKKDGTRYRKLIQNLMEKNPALRVAGFTGTPFRADTGYLHHGKNRLFTDVAYELSISWAIDQGYWCPPVNPKTKTLMDANDMRKVAGDFVAQELSDKFDRDEITQACVAEIVAELRFRKSGITYTIDTEHCEHVAEEFRRHGIRAAAMHSKIPQAKQDEIFAAYMANDIKMLVVVAMMTTGFNKPDLDLVALMRPMASATLWAQTGARGCTAIYASNYPTNTPEERKKAIENSCKPDTAVLDFGGIIDRLGPLDDIHVSSKELSSGEGDAPLKTCPECFQLNYAAAKQCANCDYEFPFEVNLSSEASHQEILAEPEKEKWLQVYNVKYKVQKKAGKQDSVLARYQCGLKEVWVWYFTYFQHEDTLRWWSHLYEGQALPKTAEEVVALLNKDQALPDKILVKRDGKYDRVLGYQ